MRTSLNVPDETIAEFDAIWQAEGIDSRSRALREAIREYIADHNELESLSGPVAAVVAFDYVHDEVIERLHAVQHDHQGVIDTTSHVHQGEWCLETVFCTGEAAAIRELVYDLRDFDGVHRVRVMSVRDA